MPILQASLLAEVEFCHFTIISLPFHEEAHAAYLVVLVSHSNLRRGCVFTRSQVPLIILVLRKIRKNMLHATTILLKMDDYVCVRVHACVRACVFVRRLHVLFGFTLCIMPWCNCNT